MREKNGRLLRSLNVENILEMLYLLAFVLLVAYMFLETTMWEVHWPGKYMDGLLCILAVPDFWGESGLARIIR